MSRIEIVSHPLCPMSQRLALIGILGKGESVDRPSLVHLAYATLSSELSRHSPSGELPVLKLDGAPATTSTEHAAEYLDRRFRTDLLPNDEEELLKVRTAERAIRLALDALRLVFTARDAIGLKAAVDGFFTTLAAVEAALPEFRPGDLSRMDLVALAPLASLSSNFPSLRGHPDWLKLPRVQAHVEACDADARVAASRCPNYAAEFDAFFAMTRSAFPQLVAVAQSNPEAHR